MFFFVSEDISATPRKNKSASSQKLLSPHFTRHLNKSVFVALEISVAKSHEIDEKPEEDEEAEAEEEEDYARGKGRDRTIDSGLRKGEGNGR